MFQIYNVPSTKSKIYLIFNVLYIFFTGFECPDQHCSNLGNGYGCILESDIDSATMDCMFDADIMYCNEMDPDSPCYCCKPKEIKCPDKDCTSLMGSDYSCVPKSLINSTMVCEFNNPGYCNAQTFTHFSNYKEEDPCFCCKTQTTQCPDKNCTTVMGKDYSCVPEEEINTVDMECEFNQYGLCDDGTDPITGCYCCKENKCPGEGCAILGSEYSCVQQSQIDATLDCNYKNGSLCNHGLYSQDPCYCCKEKQCPDKGCSDYGEGYNCFPPGNVDLNIMDCTPNDGKGLGLCNDDLLTSLMYLETQGTTYQAPCRCCKFKQNCTDVGCSTEHPGYQCMNEMDAVNYVKPCLQHNTSLCASNEGMFTDLKRAKNNIYNAILNFIIYRSTM